MKKEIELIRLPYRLGDLEPFISLDTMNFHYNNHLGEYVVKTNELLEGTKFVGLPLEKIVKETDGDLFNNAAQVLNHNFYFLTFSPYPKLEPSGKLREEIDKKFGSFSEFKDNFNQVAKKLFGSGYTWLVKKLNGSVDIIKTKDAENPIRLGLQPLIACDVWEHAYYLDYQNHRLDHLYNFWEVIDWKIVEDRYNNS